MDRLIPIYSVHPIANPTPHRTAVLFEQAGDLTEEHDHAQRNGVDDARWRQFQNGLNADDWDLLHAYWEYRGVFAQRLDEAGYVLH